MTATQESAEGATEINLKEVSGTSEKTKLVKEKQSSNLRRKSSNLRGDVDGLNHMIGEHEPAGGTNSKLEQDYIRMYLGELTPIQESRLVQLKGWVSNLLKGKVPNDPVLLRFLRARDFNVEKAREMLSQSLIWRKKHGVDKIFSDYQLPEIIRRYFPGGWHLHDNEERPLFILRLGQMDVKGIIKVIITFLRQLKFYSLVPTPFLQWESVRHFFFQSSSEPRKDQKYVTCEKIQ